MSWTSTSVTQKKSVWAVEARSSQGEAAELRYESEARARYVAAVLALGPSSLPREAIVRRLKQVDGAKRGRRRAAP